MTPEQKLGALKHAFNRLAYGMETSIVCPFCGCETSFDVPEQPVSCCNDFVLAAAAILQRTEQDEYKAIVDNIYENIGGVKPLVN